ncbi:hypothetical protein TorRG33x02_333400, partial [Trema orientale]
MANRARTNKTGQQLYARVEPNGPVLGALNTRGARAIANDYNQTQRIHINQINQCNGKHIRALLIFPKTCIGG